MYNFKPRFILIEGSFQFDESWKIGMLSTRLPCGDAAIFVKETDDNLDHEPDVKKQKLDLNRTGAKTLTKEQGVSGEGDPLLPGVDYHVTGELRTKPGRGLTTLSLSCSDKMLKWNVLGIQAGRNILFESFMSFLFKNMNSHDISFLNSGVSVFLPSAEQSISKLLDHCQ